MAAEDYWLERNIADEEAMHRSLDAKERVILNAYKQANDYLDKEINKIYKRYINKTGMDEAEARKILNGTATLEDIAELNRMARNVSDKEIQQQAKDYLKGMAVKARITHLEMLIGKSYMTLKQVADVQLSTQTDFYIDVIQEAYDTAANEAIIGQTEQKLTVIEGQYPKYVATKSQDKLQIRDASSDKLIKEVTLQADAKVPKFTELSTKYVKNILESDWKGSNYSKRIWGDTEALAKRLEELFTVKTLTGMSESEMTKALAKEFETSLFVARRLVRTEANYFAGQAKLKAWKEHGVAEYILIAVLDFRTSKVCREIDGKVFKVDEAQINVNYPPLHVFCRTIPAAYFGERTLSGNRTAIDRITNKRMEIKKRTNYQEWEDMLIKRHGKQDVEIAKKKVKNYNADLNQFRRYKNVLKDDAPKTLDDFQTLKYGDKQAYEAMKKRYRELKQWT